MQVPDSSAPASSTPVVKGPPPVHDTPKTQVPPPVASPTPSPPVSVVLDIDAPAVPDPETSAPSSQWIAVAMGMMGLSVAVLGMATTKCTKADNKLLLGIYLGVPTLLLLACGSFFSAIYLPQAKRGESKLGRILKGLSICLATASLFLSLSAAFFHILFGLCQGSTSST